MSQSHPEHQWSLLFDNDLIVGSGAYEAVVPGVSTVWDQWGRPQVQLPSSPLTRSEFSDLLKVSALSTTREREDVIAARLFGRADGVQAHNTLGYHVGTWVGARADDALRAASSSGGITTWLCERLLSDGRVDGVLHLTDSIEPGQLFGYSVSRTIEEVRAGATTKYYPGHVGGLIPGLLDSQMRLAVVGIPSVLSELRRAASMRPALDQTLRYYIGLVCGHQKSTRYAESLAWQMGFEPDSVSWMRFREKIDPTDARNYGVRVRGVRNGREEEAVAAAAQLFGTDWGLGLFKVNYSDFSDDVFNECADVVFGDAWLPDLVADGRGHNIVVARNDEMLRILEDGEASGEIELRRVSASTVLKSQAGLVRHGRSSLGTRMNYLRQRGEYTPPVRFESATERGLGRRRIQAIRVRLARASHSEYDEARRSGRFERFLEGMRPLLSEYDLYYRLSKAVAALKSRGR